VTDVPRAVFYAPHPDDETLSMGLAMVTLIALGYDVHLVSMTRGGGGGPLGSFNGNNPCNWTDHPYTHNPSREGYAALDPTSLGAARLLEARNALGAMATVTPSAGVTLGNVYHHEGGLPDGFGTTSATAVADAQAVIAEWVTDVPNAFHYTMSPTDDHPDHAACGQALRNLKGSDPSLANARFFVSRLYWAASQPNGQYPADVAAQPDLAWFSAGARKSEFDAILRNRVVKAFSAWAPAAGSFAIGYHQVAGQFASNFGSGVSIGNLWHA
jgi:LmbE family N-acetylglucosaminyl deacetylase